MRYTMQRQRVYHLFAIISRGLASIDPPLIQATGAVCAVREVRILLQDELPINCDGGTKTMI